MGELSTFNQNLEIYEHDAYLVFVICECATSYNFQKKTRFSKFANIWRKLVEYSKIQVPNIAYVVCSILPSQQNQPM